MQNSKNPATAVSRRTFLAAATALPAASLFAPLPAGANGENPAWYSTMRRCGQLNYNEVDPLTIDPEAWMDYWASLKVDAVLMNGGGIVAFYPTHIPYHHRSDSLGSRDLLGEMVTAAKKRGIRAVARMDPNHAYQDALEAHPEWFERNRDGSARPHPYSGWLYSTCMFSTYFTEQMPAIYREINQHYRCGRLLYEWMALRRAAGCLLLRRLPKGLPRQSRRFTAGDYRRFQPSLSPLLRGLHGPHF